MMVQIKTWEDMEVDYPSDTTAIDIPYSFTNEMEKHMPKNRVINLDGEVWRVEQYIMFSVSEEMIDHVLGKEEYPEYFL